MTKFSDAIGLINLGERTVEFYNAEIIRQLSVANHSSVTDLTPYVSLIAADFSTINNYLPNQFQYLKPLVSNIIEQCLSEKITTLIVPNITLHETIDQLDPALLAKLKLSTFKSLKLKLPQLKLIHPVEETIRCLQAAKINTVTLIASKYTTSSPHFEQYFKQHNISIIRPDVQHIEQIDEIRKHTYLRQETEQDKENYHAIIKHYQQTAPAVIACTELSLLLNKEIINDVFDIARIQIKAAINA